MGKSEPTRDKGQVAAERRKRRLMRVDIREVPEKKTQKFQEILSSRSAGEKLSRAARFEKTLTKEDHDALTRACIYANLSDRHYKDLIYEHEIFSISEMLQKLQKYRVSNAVRSLLWRNESVLGDVYHALTSGMSLFKFLKTDSGLRFQEPLTRQMWGLILKNNREDFLPAMRRAQCQVRGGSALLINAIQRSFLGRNFYPKVAAEFWDTVIHWFCNHDGMWDRDTIHHILDFINYQRTETPTFSMKGRTPEALMKATETWQKQLAKIKGDVNSGFYANIGTPFWKRDHKTAVLGTFEDIETWKIVQIRNAKELLREGRDLNHCVYSYNRAVVSGQTAIFSLRYETSRHIVQLDAVLGTPTSIEINRTEAKPLVTIELNIPSKSIVQARGQSNRGMTYKERDLVREWSNENGFRMSC